MRLASIHVHTTFSDGTNDIETCCRMAHKKGLESLGFSDHAPLTHRTGFHNPWHMRDEKLNEYIDTVRAAQKRWEGKLSVYLGLEVDFIPGITGPADKEYREMDLDYIIGSVHYVIPQRGEYITVDDSAERVDKLIRDGFGGDPMAMAEVYWNAVAAMISAGGFDLLGHPDLVKRNNAGQEQRLFPEHGDYYLKKTTAIASLLEKADLHAEINTGGLNRGIIKDCYPSPGFLKLLHEHHVPMVINADAHKAEDLDGHYNEAIGALLNAGYTETAIFAGRVSGMAKWKSIKL